MGWEQSSAHLRLVGSNIGLRGSYITLQAYSAIGVLQ
jgi:hypothetical protein